ncbi:hypothetical protein BKA70DRAFT_1216655 [Coprinopsis sp. MPI-PUGE-AT-0042]|nr:hypothetical protein BKA70DRAFT_1216655 [Coprinopsis sp. MPI-PUGE-AT-0042]
MDVASPAAMPSQTILYSDQVLEDELATQRQILIDGLEESPLPPSLTLANLENVNEIGGLWAVVMWNRRVPHAYRADFSTLPARYALNEPNFATTLHRRLVESVPTNSATLSNASAHIGSHNELGSTDASDSVYSQSSAEESSHEGDGLGMSQLDTSGLAIGIMPPITANTPLPDSQLHPTPSVPSLSSVPSGSGEIVAPQSHNVPARFNVIAEAWNIADRTFLANSNTRVRGQSPTLIVDGNTNNVVYATAFTTDPSNRVGRIHPPRTSWITTKHPSHATWPLVVASLLMATSWMMNTLLYPSSLVLFDQEGAATSPSALSAQPSSCQWFLLVDHLFNEEISRSIAIELSRPERAHNCIGMTLIAPSGQSCDVAVTYLWQATVTDQVRKSFQPIPISTRRNSDNLDQPGCLNLGGVEVATSNLQVFSMDDYQLRCEDCGRPFVNHARLFTHQKTACRPGKRGLSELLGDARSYWDRRTAKRARHSVTTSVRRLSHSANTAFAAEVVEATQATGLGEHLQEIPSQTMVTLLVNVDDSKV